MRSDDSQESLGQILKWGSWRHCFHSWTCQPRVLELRWESLGCAEEDFKQWTDSPIINTQVKMNPILDGNKCCDIRLCDFYLFIYGFLDSLVFKRLVSETLPLQLACPTYLPICGQLFQNKETFSRNSGVVACKLCCSFFPTLIICCFKPLLFKGEVLK